MNRVLRLISHRPWWVLAVLVAATLFAVAGIVDPFSGERRLKLDPSTNRLFPKDDPEREFYEFVRKLFGSDETMLVALSADDIFTSNALRRVKSLTERIESLPDVHHVVSLTTALNLSGDGDEIRVRRFVTDIPETPEEMQQIRDDALGNPIYKGNLVSSDGRTTALLIYFREFSDADFIERGIDAQIAAITAEEAGDLDFAITGGPHIKVAQNDYQIRDLLRSLPLMLLCAALVLALSFRTVRGVLVSIVTVTVSLVWTLGIMGWTGRDLNMVTMLIAPLFIVLPLSYVVHVVAEYYESLGEEPDATNREVTHRAMSKVWLPVALTGVTTGAGFLATVLSPIGVIQEFGLLAVAGMAATVLVSLTLPPALLGVLGRPRRVARHAEDGEGGADDLFTRFATHAANFNLKYRRSIFVASGLIVVVAGIASLDLRVGAIGIRTFPTDSRVRLDFETINQNLQGANQFHVIAQSETDGVFKDPKHLKALDDLQTWLEAQPEVGGTTSLVDYVKLCNEAFFGDYAIPRSRREATQIMFFCASDELKGFVDARHRIANVIVRANVIDTELVSALTQRIEQRIAELPEPLTARVTGNPILTNNLFDDIVRGQALSVLGAFVLIYGILWVMFLDWRTALKALIPNAIPVAFYFGALGVTGITLNFATSLIAPMALGIAIDDTIHYFSRFSADAKRLADERKATIRALRTVGRPVTFTTILLCLTFSVLLGADLQTLVQFGGLAAATLAFAWVVDFTLTPALCSGLRIVTLVDTLTLDLGENPQKAIPLFSGLSYAQCRIVAQMASMRDVPAGEALVRVGEPGDTMYAVIDGEIEVWLENGEERRTINRHKRGDVIGEVGFFRDGERSANMDVTADAKLLRLTKNNLERLSSRRPRIAARLFENLNRIQADRLAKQT